MKAQDKWKKRIGMGGVAVGLPVVLFFLCFRHFDFDRFLSELKHLNVGYFAAAFSMGAVILVAMALQWRLFLPKNKQIPFSKMFGIVSLFAMTVNTVPFWGGHAFAIYLLGHREKVGKTAALSVITLEQIAEGFGKIFLFAVVAFTCPFPEWMKKGMEAVMLVVLGAYVLLFVLAYRYRDPSESLSAPTETRFQKLFLVFKTWAHHLHAIRSFKKMLGGILLAFFMKGAEAAAIFFVQKSFGVSLPAYAPLLVLAALGLATMLPLSPGRLGVFEAAAFVIYQFLGLDPTQALTLGIFIHMVHTLPFVLIGYLVSLKWSFKRKDVDLNAEAALP
ncbi:MAG: lysylphosphatidylglycerol synthase transmembrane domain-containing protein [bacterium]